MTLREILENEVYLKAHERNWGGRNEKQRNNHLHKRFLSGVLLFSKQRNRSGAFTVCPTAKSSLPGVSTDNGILI